LLYHLNLELYSQHSPPPPHPSPPSSSYY
jgi:hypothetical protein